MDRYLIINADDLGAFQSGVAAVTELLTCGESALTSSTVMACAPWAAQACRFAAANPQLGIGVHLTLTSEWNNLRWAPVAQGCTASLRDEEGYMWHTTPEVERHAVLDEVRAELRAQVDRCRRLGMTAPSHMDNHMGSLYGIATGRWELLGTVLELAAGLRLGFRLPASIKDIAFGNTMLGIGTEAEATRAAAAQAVEFAAANGVALPDHLLPNEWGGPQDESYENFREYLYDHYASIPAGVTETYLHPALESEELKAACDTWQHRVWEYRIMRDPATKQHIEAHGIKLINYRELSRMKEF